MKFILLLVLCGITIYTAATESPLKCYDKTDQCHSSNYESYISCVKRRYKRSTDCEASCDSGNCVNSCDGCNCDSCNFRNCQNSCNSCCSSCCSNYIGCRTNHCCHKTCNAQCKSFECRSECRRNCNDVVKKTENGSSNISSTNDIRHNVTTIIHLNNVINNTNVIDVPITINNTNKNNITLNIVEKHNSTSASDEKCCTVISPRQCAPHHEYPFVRCFHYRSRQCGDFCTSAIVHKEPQQVCQPVIYPGAAPNCQQQTLYIPQPQPRCSYQSVWPYVTCGIQNSQTTSCAGCYNHYVNQNSTNYLNCPNGCYDDGFGVGPYYRQGPFYRPGYSHVPCYPCFGHQGFGGVSYGGYGGYGGYGAYGGYGGYPLYGFPGVQFGVQVVPVFPGVPGPTFPGIAGPVAPGTSLGSWVPDVEDGFENKLQLNASHVGGPFDPLISVGPGLQYPYGDPRDAREVEIEVKYEPSSSAQAEVKIKSDKTENKTKTTIDDNNLTTYSSFIKKLG